MAGFKLIQGKEQYELFIKTLANNPKIISKYVLLDFLGQDGSEKTLVSRDDLKKLGRVAKKETKVFFANSLKEKDKKVSKELIEYVVYDDTVLDNSDLPLFSNLEMDNDSEDVKLLKSLKENRENIKEYINKTKLDENIKDLVLTAIGEEISVSDDVALTVNDVDQLLVNYNRFMFKNLREHVDALRSNINRGRNLGGTGIEETSGNTVSEQFEGRSGVSKGEYSETLPRVSTGALRERYSENSISENEEERHEASVLRRSEAMRDITDGRSGNGSQQLSESRGESQTDFSKLESDDKSVETAGNGLGRVQSTTADGVLQTKLSETVSTPEPQVQQRSSLHPDAGDSYGRDVETKTDGRDRDAGSRTAGEVHGGESGVLQSDGNANDGEHVQGRGEGLRVEGVRDDRVGRGQRHNSGEISDAAGNNRGYESAGDDSLIQSGKSENSRGITENATSRSLSHDERSEGNRSGDSETETRGVSDSQEVSVKKEIDHYFLNDDPERISSYERLNNNVAALELLHEIESSSREITDDDRSILAKYSGFGGISFGSISESLEPLVDKGVITEHEFAELKRSALTAYYTPTAVIDHIYSKVQEFGFTGGKVCEPGCGVGKFIGRLPLNLRENTDYEGIELDPLTSRIASLLYPNSKIVNLNLSKRSVSNYYDLAIGNVPFGQLNVSDPKLPEFSKFKLHNYSILKSIDMVKPGGIVGLITSSFTMDSVSNAHRIEMLRHAEFLGAVRLNNGVFNNSDTHVVSDLIFFKKRDRVLDADEVKDDPFANTVELPAPVLDTKNDTWRARLYASDVKTENIRINQYFAEHKEQLTGILSAHFDGRYQKYSADCSDPKSLNVDPKLIDQYLKEQNFNSENISHYDVFDPLFEKALNNVHGQIDSYNYKGTSSSENLDVVQEEKLQEIATYSFYIDPETDTVMYRGAPGEPPVPKVKGIRNSKLKAHDLEILKALIQLRDVDREVRDTLLKNDEPAIVEEALLKLNAAYDNFYSLTDEHYAGKIKLCPIEYYCNQYQLNRDDASFSVLSYLEEVDEKGSYIGKSDVFTKPILAPTKVVENVDNLDDALILSVTQKGHIDLDYMANLLGRNDLDLIISDLGDRIYRDPNKIEYADDGNLDKYSGYVTADEYLSGNIYEKIEICKDKSGLLSTEIIEHNIAALEKVKPARLSISDIDIDIGARFVPVEFYIKFFNETFGFKLDNNDIIYDEYNDCFEFGKDFNKHMGYAKDLANYSVGSNFKPKDFVDHCLSQKVIEIYDYVQVPNKKSKTPILNQELTAQAQEIMNNLKFKFKEFYLSNIEISQRLENIYNERFNGFVPRKYDGSNLSFEGMNPNIKLAPHQANAVARTLFGGNTLLAHEVGAGKTFEICASIMEKKRLGLCKKAMISTPNAVIGQFARDFHKLYPNAKLLVLSGNEIKDEKKDDLEQSPDMVKVLSKAATGDYDCILVRNDDLKKIKMSDSYLKEYYQNRLEEYQQELSDLDQLTGTIRSKRSATSKLNNYEAKIQELENRIAKRKTSISFEELGVDALYVDEAHEFKNLGLQSVHNQMGISSDGSDRAEELMIKCRYLNEKYNHSAVTFATGTPLANSVTDLYVMEKYLRDDLLNKQGIHSVDGFIANYCSIEPNLELAPDSKEFRIKTRLAKFKNIPECLSFFGQVADVQTANMLKLPTPKANYNIVEAEPSEYQKEQINELCKRVKTIQNKLVNPKEDNMLKVTNDGRLLGLDQRVYDSTADDPVNSKVNLLVDNVFKIYKDTSPKNENEIGGTQLIFCDLSTPNEKNRSEFCIYDDVVDKLIEQGIPENEIAIVHDYDVKNKPELKEALFDKVRRGEVRVLLGSSAKLGVGVSVQNHLVAAHHLDPTWRPAELIQRNGRIIRRGNANKEVGIYYYVTKGTFDAYMYQTVERKAQFIKQIMEGNCALREVDLASGDDQNSQSFSYADVMVAALNDTRVRDRFMLQKRYDSLNLFVNAEEKKRAKFKDDIEHFLPARIKSLQGDLNDYNNFLSLHDNLPKYTDPKTKEIKTVYPVSFDNSDENLTDPKEIKEFFMKKVAECPNSYFYDFNFKIGGFNFRVSRYRDDPEINITCRVEDSYKCVFETKAKFNGSDLFSRICREFGKLNSKKDKIVNEIADFETQKNNYEKYVKDVSLLETRKAERLEIKNQIDRLDAEIEKTHGENKDFSDCNSEPQEQSHVHEYNGKRVILSHDELLEVVRERIASCGDNCNLNDLDVSNLDDFSECFAHTNFNGDISQWDVSNAENMHGMFEGSSFNGDISKWNVTNVYDMSDMFANSKFNRDISNWDVSHVEEFNGIFDGAAFNQDLSRWEVVDLLVEDLLSGSVIEEKYRPANSNDENARQQEAHRGGRSY